MQQLQKTKIPARGLKQDDLNLAVFDLLAANLQKTKIPARGLKHRRSQFSRLRRCSVHRFKKPKSPRGD